jgi:hypothetical protein
MNDYLGFRDWPDESIPAMNPLPPEEIARFFYHIGSESIRNGLKIIFDLVDPKKDGKIYRINRKLHRDPVELKFNTRQHIVCCVNEYVLIAVNSMDEFNDVVRPVFESPIFQEAILSKGIVIDIITPDNIPHSSREAAGKGGVLLAIYPTQEYLLNLCKIENCRKFVVIPHSREEIQESIDTNYAFEIVFYFD